MKGKKAKSPLLEKIKSIKGKRYYTTDPRLFGCQVWEVYDNDGNIIYRQFVRDNK